MRKLDNFRYMIGHGFSNLIASYFFNKMMLQDLGLAKNA